MSTVEKIEKAVVEGYKKIEEGAVDGFKKVDNGNIEKISDAVTGAYQKVEDAVTGTFGKMADGFVEKHLLKEGETVEMAKERIAKEQAQLQEKNKNHANVKTYDHEAAMKAQKEMIEKSIEASKNAGKR